MRDSMVFYRSFFEAIKDLPPEEYKDACNAILSYAMDGEETANTIIGKSIYTMAKPQIDSNNQKYENGKKGGRPKTETEPNNNQSKTKPKPKQNQTETKHEPNVYVNENVYVKEKDKVSPNGDKEKSVAKATPKKKVFFEDEKLNQTFLDFIAMRKKIKKPMSDKAIELAGNKLIKLSQNPFGEMDIDNAIAILEQSILSSWSDIYPLKESPPKQPKQPSSFINALANA